MNGPLGLEQGFTLQHAPEDESQDGLTLHLALGGILRSRVMDGGTAVELERVDGAPALRYAGLSAQDATGQTLPAWMEIVPSAQANEDEALLLHVNDRGAEYPLLIDPFFQKAQLTSSDGTSSDLFGWSVAISGDGNTIVVATPFHQLVGNYNQGEAYVFVKGSGGWSGNLQEQARLTSQFGAAFDTFGRSVAISGDGSAIVVSAPTHTVLSTASQGEAYVFVKPSGGWAGDLNENARLTASDGAAGDWFGFDVAITEAGSTILVGAPKRYTAQPGKAYVFVWTCFISSFCYWESKNEIAALTSSNGAAVDLFGYSVAISGGGNTIVVGAPGHDVGGNDSQGEAYVYMMPGFAWSGSRQETGILTASNGGVHDLFGSSVGIVGINGAGDRIIVGAPWHTVEDSRPQQGEVYVFVKPCSASFCGWLSGHESARLTASDAAAYDHFGDSVAISGSGATIVVGATSHQVGSNAAQGTSYVFLNQSVNYLPLIRK